MIEVSRINGKKFYLNAELIEYIESTPDTVITLIGGKTVMVKESVEIILRRVIKYKRLIHTAKIKKENNDA
ncbi:MAG: flagellar FlbD family protein [Candidatus Riflebacteria bacterium]|jgi:flagellar protein FlbD|nr:flagellar FlbD family protein [Candidatus Riflebacteria bacterium]MDD3376182.1 flagellar FlbD family protein [Candidatus Riflebacteria bacterium]NLV95640.1 flagellar FlbD family protein [Candidatus Riflebacteria bacterium]